MKRSIIRVATFDAFTKAKLSDFVQQVTADKIVGTFSLAIKSCTKLEITFTSWPNVTKRKEKTMKATLMVIATKLPNKLIEFRMEFVEFTLLYQNGSLDIYIPIHLRQR